MGPEGGVRRQYSAVREWIAATPSSIFEIKRGEAEFIFRRTGITFSVYAEGGDPERLIPFDIIPRIIDGEEWAFLARGLEQRVRALNAFIRDVYTEQAFVRANKIPAALVNKNASFIPAMTGLDVAAGIYTHVAGIDIVRVGPTEFYVLEDNCRTPSGVSYMIENREIMSRLFPELFGRHRVRPVSHYSEELLDTLRSVAPRNCKGETTRVPLTPRAPTSAA